MNQKLKLFWLLYALFFDFVSGLNAACVKMWDAGDSSNSQICDGIIKNFKLKNIFFGKLTQNMYLF